MHNCPNCGHKFATPKAPRKSKARFPHRWTVVQFKDGVTILRGSYTAEGDFAEPTESAVRMRATALAGGDYSKCARYVPQVAKSVARAWHVEGDAVDEARELAFAQREEGPLAWGKCLTDPATSWTWKRDLAWNASQAKRRARA